MKRRRPLIVPRWKYEHDVSVLADRCKLQSGEIERMARKLGRATEERDGYEAQVAELLMENDRLRRKVAALEAQSRARRGLPADAPRRRVVTPTEALAAASDAVQAVRDGRGCELPDDVRHAVQESYLDGPSDAIERRAGIVARRLGWITAAVLTLTLVVPGLAPGYAAPADPAAVPLFGSSPAVPPAVGEESTSDPLAAVVAGECETWHTAYEAAGWTADQFDTLDRIAWGETRCGIDTFNDRTGDSGLFQLSPVHCRWLADEGFPVDCRARKRDRVRVLADDPMLGIRAGRALWVRCGFGPWGPHFGRRYYCRRPK